MVRTVQDRREYKHMRDLNVCMASMYSRAEEILHEINQIA
jgi:hypothetical protein